MVKCKCGNAAFYNCQYDGSSYCSDCFSSYIEKKFSKTVSRNNLVKYDDEIAVALSGGKDSQVLVELLKKIQKPGTRLLAITIDEGVGSYRNSSIKEAKQLTKELGIEHEIFSFKKEFGFVMADIKEKPCTYCGVLKRWLLNKKAKKLGANKIATGHNLDDEALSILVSFMRGDVRSLKSLGYKSSITDGFVQRIKPLRDLDEREIVLYSKINKIPCFRENCPLSFDNQRRDMLNHLEKLKEKYPDISLQIVRTYDKLQLEQKKTKIKKCLKCGEPTSSKICKACQLLEELRRDLA